MSVNILSFISVFFSFLFLIGTCLTRRDKHLTASAYMLSTCLCYILYIFHVGRALIAGGGAPEIEVSIRLAEHARTLTGMEAYCVRAFAEALEIIPYTLAENAGLNPIATVTDLRNRHAQGETTAGINVRKVGKRLKNLRN